MAEELPRQELLIKLLGMTGSSSDGEALVAIRKANALLQTAGWTWERLIHGKIRVIADPFVNLKTPESRQTVPASMSTPQNHNSRPTMTARPVPPTYQPRPQPAAAPPPRQHWQSTQFTPQRGTKFSKTGRVPKVEPRIDEL